MFWHLCAALVTIALAQGVVFSRKPLSSALFLVFTLIMVGVHFAMLNAEFLAALQIVLYAGAIMVSVIFVIMLLGVEKGKKGKSRVFRLSLAVGFMLLFLFIASWSLFFELPQKFSGNSLGDSPEGVFSGRVEEIGERLFSAHVFNFEIISILLLVGIIASVLLAWEKKRLLPEGKGLSSVRKGNEDE